MTTSTDPTNVVKLLLPFEKGEIILKKFAGLNIESSDEDLLNVTLTEDEQENYEYYLSEFRAYERALQTTSQYVRRSFGFFFSFEFRAALGCLIWAYERHKKTGDYHPRHGKFYRKGYLK